MIVVPLDVLSTQTLEQLKNNIEVELRERDIANASKEKDVHAAHCCADHGCKYNDPNCPVVLGTAEQRFPCPECNDGTNSILWPVLDENVPLSW